MKTFKNRVKILYIIIMSTLVINMVDDFVVLLTNGTKLIDAIGK